MSIVTKVAKNTGVIFAGNLFNMGMNLIILIYIARYLGSNDFGRFSFVLAYIAFFGLLTDFGIRQIVTREISKDEKIAKKIIGNALVMIIALSFVAISLSIITINFSNYPPDTKKLIFIASFLLLFSAVGSIVGSIFAAHLQMKYSIISSVISQIIYVILAVTVITLKGSLFYVFVAMVISSFAGTVLMIVFSRKFIKPSFEFDWQFSKKILKSGIPIGISGVFMVIYNKIDIIMLSGLKNDTVVGYYSAAYRFTESFGLIPTAIMASFFPLMSKSFKTNRDSFVNLYEASLKYMFILGLPIAIAMPFFSKEIIQIIYGNNFLPSASALSILIWAQFFHFLNIVFGSVLIASGRQVVITYITFAMSILNIILNYILIPPFGFVGASVATVFTRGLGSGLAFYYIYSNVTPKGFSSIFIKVLVSNFILYLFLRGFGFIPLPFLFLSSIIIYFALLVIFNCISKEEIELIKKGIGGIFS